MRERKSTAMKIAVVSLKFSPGHIAHLKAYYEMFKRMECEVKLILSGNYKTFFDDNADIVFLQKKQNVFDVYQPDLVLAYNISQYNVPLALQCRTRKCKFYYVLHEPYPGIAEILKGECILGSIAISILNAIICGLSNTVLLASKTGVWHYEKRMKWINKNYALFPLIFNDEYINDNIERKYFLFAGAFTRCHGCDEFLRFVEYAEDRQLKITFMIATKQQISNKLDSHGLKAAISDNRLIVHEGRPMPTTEINSYYRQAICVWNMYKRTVQSGVLPNALMQGAPIITNGNGVSAELKIDGVAGVQLGNDASFDEIIAAYEKIYNEIDAQSQGARRLFLDKYFFGEHIELAKRIFWENY